MVACQDSEAEREMSVSPVMLTSLHVRSAHTPVPPPPFPPPIPPASCSGWKMYGAGVVCTRQRREQAGVSGYDSYVPVIVGAMHVSPASLSLLSLPANETKSPVTIDSTRRLGAAALAY